MLTHPTARLLQPALESLMSVRQLVLLLELSRLDPARRTVKSCAAAMGVAKPIVTRACDALAAMGLVARRVADHDARVVIMSLTDEGRVLANQCTPTRPHWQDGEAA